MDQATIELLARCAGLDKALREFPENVTAAATPTSGSIAAQRCCCNRFV
jgi:hypothetical protein